MEKLLTTDFKKLKYGLKVIDENFTIGYVYDCSDIHNVHVLSDLNDLYLNEEGEECYSGGGALHCLDKDCVEIEENDDHIIKYINYYPLFKYNLLAKIIYYLKFSNSSS